MNAIEKLYAVIAQQFPNGRITTNQAAHAIGLTRGVTSSYLSKLEKQGQLEKSGSRPVYWQIKHKKNAFDNLIGSYGSLKSNIKNAIEAIVYPSHGLPVLITGSHGTGKLLFAHAIYNEAIRRKILTEKAIFKLIDCEDYRNQLNVLKRELKTISTQSNKIKSEDSYVCIKNLQAFKPVDQHGLFTYIMQQPDSTVRYIFSTTNTNLSLQDNIYLKNAMVRIDLLDLDSRPFHEKVAFIIMFLQQQADQINKKILISPSELIKLAKLRQADNIRGLQNTIKLLVASAYARSLKMNQLVIGLDVNHAISIIPNQNLLQTSITRVVNNILQLNSNSHTLLTQLTDSLNHGEPITEQNFYLLKALKQVSIITNEPALLSLAPTLKAAAQKYITTPYGVNFPQNSNFWNQIALSSIYANLCSINLPDDEQSSKLQEALRNHYPRSYYLFKKLLTKIEPQYVKNSYYYLPFFILMASSTDKIESVQYNAILLAHGEHTASSIQQVVNSLCGNYFFEAFDMPIDVTLDQINGYVQEYLTDQSPSANGNIVLFDMGSLRQMFREIKKVSDQELIVVNNVTTAMALDIGLRVQRNDAFQSIAEASEQYGATTEAQYYEGLSNKKNIIVSCMSGVGLSEEVKKLIDATLSPALEVIAVDYKELHTLLTNHDRKFFSNTQLILTTTDVAGDIGANIGIDIVNVYNVFDKASSQKMQTVLRNCGESPQSINELIDRLVRFLSIEGIRGRLQILNPDIVIQEIQRIVSHYEDFYNVKFGSRLKLNLYMHLSLMIERMMTSKRSTTSIDRATLTPPEQEFFSLSSGIFQPVEQKFNIKVQDYEIALLYQLLKDFIFG
ncbi:PRD domain-containing protein [Pediococcus pentosaceus]|uniref:PRD domain-containing protein n=1 Tax=Lactobacillales TaxID=186826 RepID=UPI0006D8A417|nr:PRD domain-containing protein [Pediococcus pentosaceus]ANI98576.1 transcriptional regulator [Pediococcus pentosaceus]KQB79745.1 transcriptional regulator [Pediococcus pentosaceus]UQA99881.1 PRD domain-containing protein [Pediococcus pentosaceus]